MRASLVAGRRPRPRCGLVRMRSPALPDLDLIAGQHSGMTHSIGFVAIAGLGALAWTRQLPVGARGWRLRLARAVRLARPRHAPPLGVMALWPFDASFYMSPWTPLPPVSRRYWLPGSGCATMKVALFGAGHLRLLLPRSLVAPRGDGAAGVTRKRAWNAESGSRRATTTATSTRTCGSSKRAGALSGGHGRSRSAPARDACCASCSGSDCTCEGIENNRWMVEESRRLHGDLPGDTGHGHTLPFPDASFDVVISFDVFEHIAESDAHLREVGRVLVPGGRYLLQTPEQVDELGVRNHPMAELHGLAEGSLRPAQLRAGAAAVCETPVRGALPRVPVVTDFFQAQGAALPRLGPGLMPEGRQPRSAAHAAADQLLHRSRHARLRLLR